MSRFACKNNLQFYYERMNGSLSKTYLWVIGIESRFNLLDYPRNLKLFFILAAIYNNFKEQ